MIIRVGIALCCFALAIKCFTERFDRFKLIFSVLFLIGGLSILFS